MKYTKRVHFTFDSNIIQDIFPAFQIFDENLERLGEEPNYADKYEALNEQVSEKNIYEMEMV